MSDSYAGRSLYARRSVSARDSVSGRAAVARESNLVERAIVGDAAAFGELYMQHLDAIYRYIYFRVGDADDAEDLTEQVFLKAWQALPGYEQRGYPFASWLYRIAHNAVMDYHRAQSHHEQWPSMTASSVSAARMQPAAIEQVINAEEAAALSAAIAQLSDEQQQVIILRFVEGMSHAEVAHIIGKSEGACRVIQHRAISTLSHLLADTLSADSNLVDRVSAESHPLEVQRA